MSLYTSTYLKNLALERSLIFESELFSAQRGAKNHYDIFLSHSFFDKQGVKGKEFLKLYPFIKKVALTYQTFEKLWVIESKYTYSLFEEWHNSGLLETNRNTNIFEL
jgi:hypothetical protein